MDLTFAVIITGRFPLAVKLIATELWAEDIAQEIRENNG